MRSATLASALVLITLLYGHSALAAKPAEMPQITVQGDGVITAKPDQVTIELGVETHAKTAAEAARQNAAEADSVEKAMKNAGVTADDMQTINYSVNPEYSYPGGKAVLMGYQVSNMVRLRLTNLSLLAKVLDAATASGANQISGIEYGLQHPEAVQEKALKAAIAQAHQRAQLMASAENMRLLMPYRINALTGYTPPPMPMMRMAVSMAANVPSTPISPGHLKITASVTVVYLMAPEAVLHTPATHTR